MPNNSNADRGTAVPATRARATHMAPILVTRRALCSVPIPPNYASTRKGKADLLPQERKDSVKPSRPAAPLRHNDGDFVSSLGPAPDRGHPGKKFIRNCGKESGGWATVEEC